MRNEENTCQRCTRQLDLFIFLNNSFVFAYSNLNILCSIHFNAQKMKFSIKDLVTFAEEILHEKLILCAVFALYS